MWFPFFSGLEEEDNNGGAVGLGSEPTLFHLNALYTLLSLSHFNLGVVPKGQDITKKKQRLERGKLRAVLFLECAACFCL